MDNIKEIEKKLQKIVNDSVETKIVQKRFRNKKTGEVATQIPLMSMGDWEEMDKKPRPKKPNPKTAKFSDMLQYEIDKMNGGWD